METKTTFSRKNVTKNNTPKLWANISSSIRYFLVSMIGLISATDIIDPHFVKVTVLIISGVILLLKSIDLGLGVEVKD